LNNFPENQVTKFRAIYTVKVNQGRKVVISRLHRTDSVKK